MDQDPTSAVAAVPTIAANVPLTKTVGHTGQPRRLLDFIKLCIKLDVSARKGRQLIHEPWMPDPIELGPRALRWVESEIDEALARRAPRRPEPHPEPQQLQRGKLLKREAGQTQAGG